MHRRVDPALPPADGPWGGLPADAPAAVAAAAPARGRRRPRKPQKTVRGELRKLLHSRQLSAGSYRRYLGAFDTAVRTAAHLKGARRAALQGAVDDVHDIAARGSLTASRLPALYATLVRNTQWWRTGRMLGYGERVEFNDSELVWQYYPGEGIQLQVLGTFGKANGLWMSRDDDQLRSLLDEMTALASTRGGALTWEYWFDFGGGKPPWASAMAQTTGIQVLARASQELGSPAYLRTAKRALRLLQLAPPTGVAVRTKAGTRFLLYSYAPGQEVLNAFVQTLVGLWDYTEISGDPNGEALFTAGERQARLDLTATDTGAWSLYQVGGSKSTVAYHTLARDFMQNLCDRSGIPFWCDAASRWTRYLGGSAAER